MERDHTSETTCLHCLEPIATGARRCPRCQSWQRRWAGDSQNPLLETIVVVVGIAVVVALIVLWFSGTNGDQPTAPTVAAFTDLVVTEATVVTSSAGDRPMVAVLGRLENRTENTWRNLYFRVELVDAEGVLIDTFSARAYSLVVAAGAARPFKVVDYGPVRELGDYADCRVELTWAQKVD